MKEFTDTIQDELGIHACPAGRLSKLARSFPDTVVTVTKGDRASVRNMDACRVCKEMMMSQDRNGFRRAVKVWAPVNWKG